MAAVDDAAGYRSFSIPFGRLGTLKLGVDVDGIRNAGRAGLRSIKQAWHTTMNGGNDINNPAGAAAGTAAAGAAGTTVNRSHSDNPLDFPSLLQFFSSRYSISLLVLSLLINRIHAVVPPSIHYRSSWKVRAIVRGPAILLLSRACILMLGVVLRMGEFSTQADNRGYGFARISGKGSSYGMATGEVTGRDHSDALWACFVAACMACASESFIRALDHDLASITPINLFTLGLLLHFHSTPYGDPLVPPPKPVYFLLLLTLMEILCLHVVAVPGWRIRLYITGAFTVVSRGLMIHFWLNTTEKAHIALMPAIQSLGRILPEAFFVTCSLITITLRAFSQALTEGRIDSTIFGHSSSLPHRDDDFILAIIKYGTAALETTAMKGLNNEVSALSLPGETYVDLQSNSLSSSKASKAGNSSVTSGNVLTSHPDFPTITQTVPSTNAAFSNEIRQIRTSPSTFSSSSSQPNSIFNNSGNVGGMQDIDPMSRNPSLRKEIWRFLNAGWLVWKIYVWDSAVVDLVMEKSGIRRLAEGRGRVGRWIRWCGMGSGVAVEGAGAQNREREREGVARELRRLVEGRTPAEARRLVQAIAGEETRQEVDEVDEEEDGDYLLEDEQEDSDGDESSSSVEASDSEDEEEDGIPILGSIRARSVTPSPVPLEELNELLDDQRQQLQASDDEDDLAPVLLAHMQAGLRRRSQADQGVSNASSPLTRRRYNALLYPGPFNSSSQSASHPDYALASAIASRRRLPAPPTSSSNEATNSSNDQWDETTFRTSTTCVVCCTDSRTIVLWPCRCLALCDGCRGELASRSSGMGGSSLCPCCRSEIQGYSRIHIP